MADNQKSDFKRKILSIKTSYHAASLSSLEILFRQYREQINMVPEKILNTKAYGLTYFRLMTDYDRRIRICVKQHIGG